MFQSFIERFKENVIILFLLFVLSGIILLPHGIIQGTIDKPYVMGISKIKDTLDFENCSKRLQCNRVVGPLMVKAGVLVLDNFFSEDFAFAVSAFLNILWSTTLGLFFFYLFLKTWFSWKTALIGILISLIGIHSIYFNYLIQDSLIFMLFALGFYLIRTNKNGLFWVITLGALAKETTLLLAYAYFVANLDLKKHLRSLSPKKLFKDEIIQKTIYYSVMWAVVYFTLRFIRIYLFNYQIKTQFFGGFEFIINLTQFYTALNVVLYIIVIIWTIYNVPKNKKFLKRQSIFFMIPYLLLHMSVAHTKDWRIYQPLLIIIIPVFLFWLMKYFPTEEFRQIAQ